MEILQHKFVELIPDVLDDGILYITLEYCTAIHKCVCGCGNEVVTPIAPKDWQITFDGKSVSLCPSIGNWNFTCKSHYWIKNNHVVHVRKWTDKEIKDNRDELGNFNNDVPLNKKRKKRIWDFFHF